MYIAEWESDDDDVIHLARHGVTVLEVWDVWEGRPKFRRNKKSGRATHQMIGPDRGGRFLVVYIRESAQHEGRWRAITAREALPQEREWWEKS